MTARRVGREAMVVVPGAQRVEREATAAVPGAQRVEREAAVAVPGAQRVGREATAAGPAAQRVGHIVWDWNGTILGDSPALIAATIDAFRTCGLPPISRADYQRHHIQPIPLFYERLAGRALSPAEQADIAECFRAAYARHREAVTLTTDAAVALERWAAAGGTQSLLSMYPHDELVPLVTAAGIAPFFARIDGSVGSDLAHKAPHLARHLERLKLDPAHVLLVGDSVDDTRAARECGVRCLVYHSGDEALHSREHFTDAGSPVVDSLRAAVDVALSHLVHPRVRDAGCQ